MGYTGHNRPLALPPDFAPAFPSPAIRGGRGIRLAASGYNGRALPPLSFRVECQLQVLGEFNHRGAVSVP